MSDKIALTAEIRSDVGKGASRRLRRSGEKIPAIIYGAEDAAQNLTLAANELAKAMQQEAFFSQIMDIVVEGKTNQAVGVAWNHDSAATPARTRSLAFTLTSQPPPLPRPSSNCVAPMRNCVGARSFTRSLYNSPARAVGVHQSNSLSWICSVMKINLLGCYAAGF